MKPANISEKDGDSFRTDQKNIKGPTLGSKGTDAAAKKTPASMLNKGGVSAKSSGYGPKANVTTTARPQSAAVKQEQSPTDGKIMQNYQAAR